MPVARNRGHAGKALLVAAAGVVVAVGLAFGVAVLASRGDVEIRLGDDQFNAGQVENIAARIGRERIPAFYPPLVGDDRPIAINHVGDDPEVGWVAVGAFDPAEPDCLLDFDDAAQVFVSRCDAERTWPRTGEGLRQYPTTVEDGRLYVDINELTTTTTAG